LERGLINQQPFALEMARRAEQQKMQQSAPNFGLAMGGGSIRQEPGMIGRGLSGARSLFFGEQDPRNKSVMDPQFIPMQGAPSKYEGVGMDLAMPLMTLYHGSPHMFDKFDMSKIGTGEGNQAYGYGLYMAENPAVAKEYRDHLTKSQQPSREVLREYYKPGQLVDGYGGKDRVVSFEEWPDSANGQVFAGWAVNVKRQKKVDGNWVDDPMERVRSHATTPEPREIENVLGEKQGGLYQIDLPDEHIDKMLDFDKPFDKQPEKIKNIFKNTSGGYRTSGNNDHMFQKWVKSTRGSIDLRQSGIPGIKYLDAQSRRPSKFTYSMGGIEKGLHDWEQTITDQHGVSSVVISATRQGAIDKGERLVNKKNLTRNFVVFDDTLPQITHRNNQSLGLPQKAKK
tara:strand:+ start:61 stop:1254 length:1194 start_codon:yes stop_codon:yes gene_type:complete